MVEESILNIIKEAIALEKHGYNFYITATEKANSNLAKSLFNEFADDEKQHMKILEEQYKNLLENNEWSPLKREDEFQVKDIIKDIEEELKHSDFDITAVYIAMNLEEKAEKYYREKIESVEDDKGKKILKWLAD